MHLTLIWLESGSVAKKRCYNNDYRFENCPKGLSPGKRKRLVLNMLFDIQNGRCFYCSRLVNKSVKKIKKLSATMDHIIPVSKKGDSSLDNVLMACSECNHKRGSRMINPVTNSPLVLPLNFGLRWNALKDKNE